MLDLTTNPTTALSMGLLPAESITIPFTWADKFCRQKKEIRRSKNLYLINNFGAYSNFVIKVDVIFKEIFFL